MTQQLENSAEMASEKCGRWNKFSESKLVQLEKQILRVLKKAYEGWFVNIGSVVGSEDKIWTIALNRSSKSTPLVCLHGFGAAVGFWCLNLDALAEKRPVYAIDLLGFGRSSRPKFSNCPLEAEQQMIQSLEEWRIKMNIEKFILMGHSFGGYLATSYTISYPNRVKHLILADPWGFAERNPDFNPSLKLRTLGFILYPFTTLNPLAVLRAAGPFGPWIVSKTRADISIKYEEALGDKELISNYIYQCNSQNPTGETAFHSMIRGFGWAKNPMINRIDQLQKEIPVTVLFGSHTWMDKTVGHKLKEIRPESYVKVEFIQNAGHHIHADQPEQFNAAVVNACDQFEMDIDDVTSEFEEIAADIDELTSEVDDLEDYIVSNSGNQSDTDLEDQESHMSCIFNNIE